MTSKEQIVAKAIELLQDQPHGLSYSELHKAIRAALPDANPHTIGGTLALQNSLATSARGWSRTT